MDSSFQEVAERIAFLGCRYWMVPLLGVEAAGVSLPVTARGAILDSSSAFSLVTERDFLIFQVSARTCLASVAAQLLPLAAAHARHAWKWPWSVTPQRWKALIQPLCVCYSKTHWEKSAMSPTRVLQSRAGCAVAAGSVILSPDWVLPSHWGLWKHHRPAKPHSHTRRPQLHAHTPELCGPGSLSCPFWDQSCLDLPAPSMVPVQDMYLIHDSLTAEQVCGGDCWSQPCDSVSHAADGHMLTPALRLCRSQAPPVHWGSSPGRQTTRSCWAPLSCARTSPRTPTTPPAAPPMCPLRPLHQPTAPQPVSSCNPSQPCHGLP